MFSNAMSGIIVSCTGLGKEERDEIHRMIEYMVCARGEINSR